MTAEANGELRPIDVVKALRARGIDNAEELLQYATLERIQATCQWWDGKPGVGPGLLAKKIKEGGMDAQPKKVPGVVQARLSATFAEYAQRFPVGSVAETHAQLQGRRHQDGEPCPGSMIRAKPRLPAVRARVRRVRLRGVPAGGLDGVHSAPTPRDRRMSDAAVQLRATYQLPKMALSIEEACNALGISWDLWDKHVAPEIRMVHLGRRRLVPVSELQRWLAEHAELDGVS